MCDTIDNEPNKPEFKPGDTPYLLFGNSVLNNNIAWREVLEDIVQRGSLSYSQIAGKLEVTTNIIKTIINGNNCPLTFKQGARLLAIQDCLLCQYR